MKNIQRRVQESFSENDQDQVRQYIEWLRPVMADYIQSIRRNTAAILLVMAISELVEGSRNAQFNIGSFSITHGSVTLIFLPVLVGFLFLQTMIDTQKADRTQNALSAAIKRWHPAVEENDLDSLLYGPEPLYWSPFTPFMRKNNMYQFDKVEGASNAVFLFIFVIAVLAFEGQTYYALFPTHLYAAIAWSISLLVTLACLTFGIFLIAADTDDTSSVELKGS